MAKASSGDAAELIPEFKSRLRRGLLAHRRSTPFDPDAAARHALTLVGTAGFVASYSPLPLEPSPALLPARALPRLRPDGDLDLVAAGPLGPGPRGTTAPAGPDLGWQAADLVIVPALAVAHDGVRLGRGGGSYDRALARVRPGIPIVALLALDSEWVATLPALAHDVRVTHVARPGGLEEVRAFGC